MQDVMMDGLRKGLTLRRMGKHVETLQMKTFHFNFEDMPGISW